LGTSDEKPHKDDETGKDEAQYDVVQEEYDSSVGSILELLKQKATEFFGTMQQKTSEVVENGQKKVREVNENVGSTIRLLRLQELPKRR
jgi:hypothetical protein